MAPADEHVVNPSQEDSFVRGASELLGGPLGEHAVRRRDRIWTPARIVIALAILVFFVAQIGYGFFCEWLWRGQTVGKWMLRLRVVDAYGLQLQFSQIVIRNLLRGGSGNEDAYTKAFTWFVLPHGLLAVSIAAALRWHRPARKMPMSSASAGR